MGDLKRIAEVLANGAIMVRFVGHNCNEMAFDQRSLQARATPQLWRAIIWETARSRKRLDDSSTAHIPYGVAAGAALTVTTLTTVVLTSSRYLREANSSSCIARTTRLASAPSISSNIFVNFGNHYRGQRAQAASPSFGLSFCVQVNVAIRRPVIDLHVHILDFLFS